MEGGANPQPPVKPTNYLEVVRQIFKYISAAGKHHVPGVTLLKMMNKIQVLNLLDSVQPYVEGELL